MSLFQVAIPRDHDYEIMTELMELDICHYVDLNKHLQSHQLLYYDMLKRAEETQKKITYIENIYREYSVKLKAPQEIEKLNEAIEKILTQSKLTSSRLLGQIEQDIHSQAEFLKKQHTLILNSVEDYRKVIARILFLEEVARIMKI